MYASHQETALRIALCLSVRPSVSPVLCYLGTGDRKFSHLVGLPTKAMHQFRNGNCNPQWQLEIKRLKVKVASCRRVEHKMRYKRGAES